MHTTHFNSVESTDRFSTKIEKLQQQISLIKFFVLTGIRGCAHCTLCSTLCVQYTCPIDELQSIKWISTKKRRKIIKSWKNAFNLNNKKKSVMILRCRDEFIEINFCLLECTPVHCTVHTGVFEKNYGEWIVWCRKD